MLLQKGRNTKDFRSRVHQPVFNLLVLGNKEKLLLEKIAVEPLATIALHKKVVKFIGNVDMISHTIIIAEPAYLHKYLIRLYKSFFSYLMQNG